MPERSSVGFEMGVRTQAAARENAEPEPFRIAVFGDFSGRRAARSARPIRIDRDNFDQVLARIAPSVDVPLGEDGPRISLAFSSLDDFHPDSLYRRVPMFRNLRENHPALAATAASAKPQPANLLEQMIEEQTADQQREHAAAAGDLQEFIDRALAGALVPGKKPEEQDSEARTHRAAGEWMRALLRHPDFQALEAAWRSISFLTRRLETGVDLQIHLLDVSKQELRDDLNGATDLRATAFFERAVANARGEPWALLVGNYCFGAGADDVELLARLGMVAAQARAPFLGGALPDVLGAEALEGMPEPREWLPEPAAAQFWQALRDLPEAAFLGLLMPRFLLRLPYGEQTSPTEEFPFEEMPGAPAHAGYLWGNPAFGGALLLGQAFVEDGWRMRPGTVRELPRLPLHTFERDGETAAQPCAEAWLTDRAAEAILARGIMPMVSARNGDSALVVRFQSVADPPQPLAGRW